MNKTLLATSLVLALTAGTAVAQDRSSTTHPTHQAHSRMADPNNQVQNTQQTPNTRVQSNQATERGRSAEANANATQTDMRPDAWLLTKVKAQFATSDIVDATDINIDVKDGVAWLSGNVGSAAEQREAVRLAQTTEGVKSVNSSGLKLVAEHKADGKAHNGMKPASKP